jgi:hypothetical protein
LQRPFPSYYFYITHFCVRVLRCLFFFFFLITLPFLFFFPLTTIIFSPGGALSGCTSPSPSYIAVHVTQRTQSLLTATL